MEVRFHRLHVEITSISLGIYRSSHFVVSFPNIIQINQTNRQLCLLQEGKYPRSEISMFSEMPQQGDLPQRSPRQNNLVENPSDTLDSYRLPRETVLHLNDQTVRSLTQWTNQAPA